MRWGDNLEFAEIAGPGDFIYVPPYVPHQEINAGSEVCEAVVVRSGQDPIVVNLRSAVSRTRRRRYSPLNTLSTPDKLRTNSNRLSHST